ncbi:MAG: tetratricopeptide repeat protein [Polyangiales bacterium]
MSDDDNIIHVSFGKDGNARRHKKPPKERERPARDRPESKRRRSRNDPLADLYSRREVTRLFGCTESQLRYWDRAGFIQPSGKAGKRRYYTFQDLISIRAAKGLLDQGVPLRRVRRSVDALRRALPKVVRPLQELRVVADGATVLVRDEAGAFEPTTGQLVLDFRVDSLREDVVRVLRDHQPSPDKRRTAYEHYLEGCRLDEDDATLDRAEEAYRQAIRLDPSLSNALTNLGNLRYRRGAPDEAEQMYERALAVDPSQPEAAYNLGFLAYERGDVPEAADWFERALRQDPSFADAHFNLAMAFEELGRVPDARAHWSSYLELEPTGPWADIARRHLDR